MSLTIEGVQNYWGTQTALTALVAQNQVWVDIAGDNKTLPYVILEQVGVPEIQWQFTGNYITFTRIRITAYATTLASISSITSAVITAYKWAQPTSASMFARLESIIPACEEGGAYHGATEWTIVEKF